MSTLFQRLKERKLVQWGIAYLGVAWVLLEAFGFVADRFVWPAALVRGATILLGVGFLIVLVLAWHHGEKGRQRATGVELAIIAALVVAGGILVTVVGPPAVQEAGSGTSALTLPSLDSLADHSIAVLPLENRSGLEEDAYFTDGIHDELLTRLLGVGALRVISRTSVMQYRDRPENLRTVGRELGARYVVEGGVQRAGDRVRITVQLVDAVEDRHLWADSYDRELTIDNLLSIQSEVAAQIAAALRVELTPGERARLASRPTRSLDAYNLYQQGRHLQNQLTEDALRRSIELFEGAIEIDPEFAPAFAMLGESYMWLVHGFASVRPRDAYPPARAAASRALELDSALAEAHTLLGHLAFEVDWDWERAERRFKRALELSPSSATAHDLYGWHLTSLDRFDDALAEFQRAYTLDPLSPRISLNLSAPFEIAGDYDRAIEQVRATLDLHPNYWLAYVLLGECEMRRGRYAEGVAVLERAVEANPSGARARASLGHAYAVTGRTADARGLLSELLAEAQDGYVWPLAPALIHTGLGEMGEAINWIETAYEERVTQLIWLGRRYPEFDPLLDDPRYREVLARIGAPRRPGEP